MTQGTTAGKKALGKVAKKGVAWSFLREGVTEVLLFPASMVVSRLLTPAEFGITSAALFFIQLAARLSDLGFNAALVRSKVVSREHFTSVFVVNVSVGALAFLVLVFASPFIGAFYNNVAAGQILPIAAFSFLIAPFGAVPGAILTRDMRFRETSIVDWNYCLTFAVLSIVLAWMGFSYWSLVYARVASVAAQTLTRIYFARWRPSFRFSVDALRDVFSFGIGMHTRRLLDYTSGNFDNLVVGRLMGMDALGLYDKAFSTMSRFLGRMNTGGPTVMFRIFAMIHEEPARFRSAYSKVIMSATLLGFPILAVMAVTGEPLMVILFGANWSPAIVPFQILCAAGALKLLNSYASSAAQASGRVWLEVWRQVTYIVLIVAGLVAFRSWGPPGAAIGVLLATIVMSVMMHVLLRRVTGLTWWEIIRPQVPSLLCAAVVAAVTYAVGRAMRTGLEAPSQVSLLVVQGATAALAYVAFVFFAPHTGLRALVREMLVDLAPPFVTRHPWMQLYLSMDMKGPTASDR